MAHVLAVATIAGSLGLSAYSTLEEGKDAAKLGKIAQQQYEIEAQGVGQAGRVESREKRKEARRFKAAQIARIGAQGGRLSGSNLLIIGDTAEQFEADARTITYNFQTEAIRLRNRGAIERYKGRVARRAARIRAGANFLNSLASLITGGAMSSNVGGPSASTVVNTQTDTNRTAVKSRGSSRPLNPYNRPFTQSSFGGTLRNPFRNY